MSGFYYPAGQSKKYTSQASKPFYSPSYTDTSNYVASKRTSEGALKYPTQAVELGIEKQKALQSLEKSYAETIENAYASYLANQQTIAESAMGQGYKERYLQAKEEELSKQVAQAALSTSETRNELEQQETSARAEIDKQFTQEVNYLDRVANTMNDYLAYVKDLKLVKKDEEGKDIVQTALSADDEKKSTEELYELLYNLDPKDLVDVEGAQGKSYAEWIRTQMKDTKEDKEWFDWLTSGGYQDFLTGVKSNKSYVGYYEAQEQTRQRIKKLEGNIENYINTASTYVKEHSDIPNNEKVQRLNYINIAEKALQQLRLKEFSSVEEQERITQEVLDQLENFDYQYDIYHTRNYNNHNKIDKAKREKEKRK